MKFFLQLIQGNTRNISLLKYSFLQKLWTGCIIRPICRLQYLEVNVAAAETEFAKRCKQRAGMCAGALFGRISSERPTRPLETVFSLSDTKSPFPTHKRAVHISGDYGVWRQRRQFMKTWSYYVRPRHMSKTHDIS